MKLVRMRSGHGDVLLAEGDPEVAEDEERLVEEFRRQLDWGCGRRSRPPSAAIGAADDGARLRRGPARRRAGDLLPRPPGAECPPRAGADPGPGRAARARADARGGRRARLRGLRAARLRLGHRRATRATPTSSTPTGRWSPTTPRPASCWPSTASASPTTASGCRPPTTCSPSGWRCAGSSTT